MDDRAVEVARKPRRWYDRDATARDHGFASRSFDVQRVQTLEALACRVYPLWWKAKTRHRSASRSEQTPRHPGDFHAVGKRVDQGEDPLTGRHELGRTIEVANHRLGVAT